MYEKTLKKWTASMIIRITKDNIDYGTRGKGDKCPIARSLRALGCTDIIVGTSTIEYVIFGKAYSRPTPLVCLRFITEYDGGATIPYPIEFELPFPQQELVVLQKEEPSDELRSLLGQSC